MKERLFLSLGEQLKHEVFFVSYVSRPYFNPTSKNKIIDFKYNSHQYQLVLNGNIMLKTTNDKIKVESFDDLIQGLIQSKRTESSPI